MSARSECVPAVGQRPPERLLRILGDMLARSGEGDGTSVGPSHDHVFLPAAGDPATRPRHFSPSSARTSGPGPRTPRSGPQPRATTAGVAPCRVGAIFLHHPTNGPRAGAKATRRSTSGGGSPGKQPLRSCTPEAAAKQEVALRHQAQLGLHRTSLVVSALLNPRRHRPRRP